MTTGGSFILIHGIPGTATVEEVKGYVVKVFRSTKMQKTQSGEFVFTLHPNENIDEAMERVNKTPFNGIALQAEIFIPAVRLKNYVFSDNYLKAPRMFDDPDYLIPIEHPSAQVSSFEKHTYYY